MSMIMSISAICELTDGLANPIIVSADRISGTNGTNCGPESIRGEGWHGPFDGLPWFKIDMTPDDQTTVPPMLDYVNITGVKEVLKAAFVCDHNHLL